MTSLELGGQLLSSQNMTSFEYQMIYKKNVYAGHDFVYLNVRLSTNSMR